MSRKREDDSHDENEIWRKRAMSTARQANDWLLEIGRLERENAALRGGAAAAASREWRAAGTPSLLAVGHVYRPQLCFCAAIHTCHHAPADGTGPAHARAAALPHLSLT